MGQGTTTQLTAPLFKTVIHSFSDGSWSWPSSSCVESLKGRRVGRPGENDPRRAHAAELQHAFSVPGRDEIERVRIGELDAGPLDVRIEVGDVDELRPTAVGGCRDGACQLLMTNVGGNGDDLTGLDVRADLDCEVGQTLEELVVSQAGASEGNCQAPSRRIAILSPARVIPVTSTSGAPIMKSMCSELAFTRSRSPSSSTANENPEPSAMWLAAFSSSRVS